MIEVKNNVRMMFFFWSNQSLAFNFRKQGKLTPDHRIISIWTIKNPVSTWDAFELSRTRTEPDLKFGKSFAKLF